MSPLHSTRSGFDKYSYWIAFIFVSCFVAYFLTSMIRLADKEDHSYNTALLEDYQEQGKIIKAQRSERGESALVDEEGNVAGLE